MSFYITRSGDSEAQATQAVAARQDKAAGLKFWVVLEAVVFATTYFCWRADELVLVVLCFVAIVNCAVWAFVERYLSAKIKRARQRRAQLIEGGRIAKLSREDWCNIRNGLVGGKPQSSPQELLGDFVTQLAFVNEQWRLVGPKSSAQTKEAYQKFKQQEFAKIIEEIKTQQRAIAAQEAEEDAIIRSAFKALLDKE